MVEGMHSAWKGVKEGRNQVNGKNAMRQAAEQACCSVERPKDRKHG